MKKSYRHCLFLLYFVFYFPAFFWLERISVPKFIISCPIDNFIPFCEWFIIPYCLWYITMPVSLLLFLFKDKKAYCRLCFIMFTGMTVSLFIYFLFPNGLELRVPIEGNNIAAQLCRMLQSIDTPTNVCPSIHVSSSVAIDMAVQKSEVFKNNMFVRVISFIVMAAVCMSTVFLKQHSMWDVLGGWLLSVILMIIYDKVLEAKICR